MLPILHYRDQIKDLLKSHKKLIVTAPPGTGKSTQIPQFFANRCSPGKKLIMLEPRRIAARSLAYRVAEEMGCACGEAVGYQVRFERRMSEKTKIQFLTYGTFLQLLHSDPAASRSSIIVFDEFHERSLDADMALAYVRFLRQAVRRDLEIMVLSATLEIEPLQKYLEGCAAVDVPDRAFPVELRYQPPVSHQEFLSKQLERALMGMIKNGEQGSILVFLPGVYEIERAAEALFDQCKKKGYRLLQLHGRMPLAAQQEVLRLPGGEPCVILSTNVAETSLTVPGVTAVIDSGFARIASYDPERERNTLYLRRISLQNAKQRAGRAGRLAKGVCVRLWGGEDERAMPKAIAPEALRIDLSGGMLTLCSLVASFHTMKKGDLAIELLTPPPAERWLNARDTLARCGALSFSADGVIGKGDGRAGMPLFPLTELGRTMGRLPLEPAVAAVLLGSRSAEERTVNAAMAAIWENADRKFTESNDLFALAELFLDDRKGTEWGRETQETFLQLGRIMQGEEAPTFYRRLKKEDIRKEVTRVWLRVFNHRLAVRTEDSSVYAFADGKNARLALKKTGDKGILYPKIVLALAVHEQAGRGQAKKVTMPLYLPLETEWITGIFPNELQRTVECGWDEARQRVIVEERLSVRGIVLAHHELENKAQFRGKIASCLAEQLLKGVWDWRKDDPKAEQFAFRVKQTARVYQEMKIPMMTDSDWELIYYELCEGKSSLEEIRHSSVIQAIKSYLGPHRAGFVEKYAPEFVVLPSGKKGRITYFDNAPPELSARLGDFIGYKDRFTLMDGRVQGIFNILAPNYRTVQKTADLGSFWKNVYPSIKNELKRKYPRHPWP
jgi:ATP-dependent helicase HrpB